MLAEADAASSSCAWNGKLSSSLRCLFTDCFITDVFVLTVLNTLSVTECAGLSLRSVKAERFGKRCENGSAGKRCAK